MADYDVQIRISADGNAAIQSVSRVQNAFRTMGTQGGQSMRQLGNESRGLLGNIRSLESGVQTLMGGFVGHQAIQAIGRLREIGDQARFARLAFEEMAGGPDGAVAALNQLREATGGVIDDVTLMSQSTRLQLLGLADGAQEAGELFATLSQIARITGQSIDSALSTFQLTIANESFMRLDSLGLSVESVKNRVEELKAAGMDASDAFRQAVIEGMSGVVETIGDAATAGETAFARMQVRIQNMTAELGIFINRGIEAGAQLAELALLATETGQQRRLDFEADTRTLAALSAGDFRQQFGGNLADVQYLFSAIRDTQFVAQQLGLQMPAPETMTGLFPGTDLERWQWAFNQLEDVQGRLLELDRERARENERFLSMLGRQRYEMEAQAAALEAQAAAAAEAERRRDVFDQFIRPISLLGADATGIASLFQDARTPLGLPDVPEFITPAQAADIEAIAKSAEALFAEAKDAFEEELITEADLAMAERYAEEVRAIADEAGRAADNFERATLETVFGQGVRNPIAGGISGDLLSEARESGLFTDEELAELQDQLDLYSGAQTEASLIWRDDVVPLLVRIADEYGPDAMIAASQRLEAAMQQGLLSGTSPDEIVDRLMAQSGFMMLSSKTGGDPMLVEGKLGTSGIGTGDRDVAGGGAAAGGVGRGDFGIPPTAEMSVIAEKTQDTNDAWDRTKTAIEQAANALDPFNTDLSTGLETSQLIQGVLKDISETEYEVRLAVTADTSSVPQWLNSLIDSRIMQVNRATGSPPGSDPRRGASARSR